MTNNNANSSNMLAIGDNVISIGDIKSIKDAMKSHINTQMALRYVEHDAQTSPIPLCAHPPCPHLMFSRAGGG